MATYTQVQLVAPQALGISDASLYTVATQTTVWIGRAVFTNTSASAVTLTAGITTGGALVASNTLISSYTLQPGVAYVSPELAGAVVPATSQIRAFASATGVTVTISGVLIT